MNKKFSIIIPIYNAENFLKRAVDSALNQNKELLEIILVNDGSTDNSGKICDEYAQKYDYIKVIHKKNGGLSTARNAGLSVATGTHISFLDADDFFDTNTYDAISDIIEKYNPDCIDFGWKYINDMGEISYNLHKMEKNKVLNTEAILEKIIPPLINIVDAKEYFIYDFAVNKIYKKEIIDKYDICFDEHRRTWEDRIFVVEYLKYCKSFYSMDQCFYNYVSVPNSLSRRYDMDFFDIILSNYKKYQELFGQQYNFECQYAQNYWCHSIENMIFRSLEEKNNKEKIEKNIEKILTNEQVIQWYRKRNPENEYEKATSKFIVSNEGNKALSIYKSIVKKEIIKNRYNRLKYMIRRLIKR